MLEEPGSPPGSAIEPPNVPGWKGPIRITESNSCQLPVTACSHQDSLEGASTSWFVFLVPQFSLVQLPPPAL